MHLRPYFPHLVSYQRFVELLPRPLIPLCGSLSTRKGRCTGMACIASTPLAVCDTHRIATHKVFEGLARRGKTSMGWFYGFTLHIIVNDEGELLAFRLTPGNVDDHQPGERLATGFEGQLLKNMKNCLIRLWGKLLLRKRAPIETINDQLKNISQIEYIRHRSVTGFMVHLIAGLVAYSFRPKKPSLGLKRDPLLPMLVV